MTILFSLCTFIYGIDWCCINIFFWGAWALGAGELKLTANNFVTSLDGAFGAFKTVDGGVGVNSVKRKSSKALEINPKPIV